MAEHYTGVKFKTVFDGTKFGYGKERAEIVKELKRLGKRGVLEANNGNLSIHVKEGIVITPSAKDMSQILADDLVLVTDANEKTKVVKTIGRTPPSSEAIMHWLIYKNFPDAKAVVHFHDNLIMKNHKKFVETEKHYPYGTVELAHAALVALKKSDFIILKEHGPLTIGAGMDDCQRKIDAASASIY